MNLLFIGDIVGHSGRSAVQKLVPDLRREFNLSMVIANAENIAAGAGLTGSCLKELRKTVDFFTAGDHVWDQKEFEKEINGIHDIVRPANLSDLQPGVGMKIVRNPVAGEIAVMALQGKVFMRDSAYCPFETAEKLLTQVPGNVKTILVDFHAEATSEKIAMGYVLDGKYDYGTGDWNNAYIVTDLYEESMVLTADAENGDVCKYVRCNEVPEEIITWFESEDAE